MGGNNPSPTADSTTHFGRTLLPGPLAQAVSLATRSSCFAIRLGSTAGTFGLDAAKFTTLSSLELARCVVEGVLSRAGRDTITRSNSDLARENAESVIERSLESLHRAMTHAVFWTTAGFRMTSTTISMASGMSQLFLSSLDQLFGSTDSSRAIASIVTLIRRELNDPRSGCQGEKVGVIDLVLGMCAVAYLQGRSWRSTAEKLRRREYEEIIWDVVVLDNGERIDVQGQGFPLDNDAPAEPESSKANTSVVRSSRSLSLNGQSPVDLSDGNAIINRFKEQIAGSLPPDTTVSITSSVSTTRTITIDVDGSEPFIIPSLPGAEVIETQMLPSSRPQKPGQSDGAIASVYRIVYKLEHNQVANTSISRYIEQSQPPYAESELAIHAPREDIADSKMHDVAEKALPPVPIGHSATSISNGSTELRQTPENTSEAGDLQNLPNPTEDESHGSRQPKSHHRPSATEDRPMEALSQGANQKKARVPLKPVNRNNSSSSDAVAGRKTIQKRKADSTANGREAAKKGGLKQVLKGGGQTFASMWHRDSPTTSHSSRKVDANGGVPSTSITPDSAIVSTPKSVRPPSAHLALPSQTLDNSGPSRGSWVSIHERRRDSLLSQTDTYSKHSAGGYRPPSAGIGWVEELSDPDQTTTSSVDGTLLAPPSPSRGHRRSRSHGQSLYSTGTNESQASLVLSTYYQKSVYNKPDALSLLRRDGTLDGIFPNAHILQNITRYMRFSSASYGSRFLTLLGISKEVPSVQTPEEIHNDVRHFIHHTESHTGSILLASFVDPQGGTDSSGSTGRGVPLVHYISLDHGARAVVLACRGTLGFEDVLADMACDYDTLVWRGKGFKVHKGVHASARRLLHGGDGRVMLTLREALAEFPDYGLVLCGHSLGGAVTSLLGIMLAEPNPTGTGFVTANETQKQQQYDAVMPQYHLPTGRPIHVYAYGPPGTMSASLRKRTRGLITSVVHGNDVVPCLSLGVLHDFQTVAVAFKNDQQQAMVAIRQKLWQALQSGITDKWYRNMAGPVEDDMEWVLSTLQKLRSSMRNEKLVPPGEVFTIENQRVLRRDAFLVADEGHVGRPAQRLVLKYVKDVEARFQEMRFGTSMFVDHSPAKYEEALNKLRLGVVD